MQLAAFKEAVEAKEVNNGYKYNSLLTPYT